MHIKHILLFILLFTLNTASASAVEINDEGAAKLREMLDQSHSDIKKTENVKINFNGEISVEKAKGYYAVTYPASTIEKGKIIVQMDSSKVNAIPTKDPDLWKMTMALPNSITVKDGPNKDLVRIDLGQQHFSGTYSEKMNGYPKYNAKYKDVKMTFAKKGDSIIIGNLEAKSNLTEKSGLLSGPVNAVLSNISFNSQKIKNELSIDRIKFDINKKDLDQKAHQQALSTMQDADTELNANTLMALIKSAGSGVSLSYDGLTFKPNTPNMELVPQSFATTIGLNKLPIMDLMKFAEQAEGADPKDPNAQRALAGKAMQMLPQKLQAAGSSISLKNTHFGNGAYDVKIDGVMKAQSASKMGGVGELNIQTKGLDKIMQALQSSPKGAQMAQQLTMFRMISEEKGDKNIARIKLNDQGGVTINGKDMSALMGGAMGGRAPAK